MAESLFWLALFLGGIIALAYHRVDYKTSTIAIGIALVAYTIFGDGNFFWLLLLWLVFAGLAALNFEDLRRDRISRPLLRMARELLPPMSRTEREALEAGSVWWEGELFGGLPDWDKLVSMPAPKLSEEEHAFLDGPCEELCRMLDDWKITHEQGDMSPEVWRFIKDRGFFAMIIPKRYGGLEFSALAHSAVLAKVASRSATAASTIAVPNSLGPAELLLHYGTEAQKERYLPGLANGTEVPCFALTGPRAGSDAASIPDTGIVCKGELDGEEIVGIRLNWDKRYITLAPIATVLGLAFKLYDPEHLIGDQDDLGITAALIPTDTPGVTIGRRHYPINIPFQNGPTQGKDVFMPLDCIIGGVEMAGEGWRMLMEQLAVGRCISLPSNATGGAKAATRASGAYARIRRQFDLPIAEFEGVGEALARMAGRTYTMNAGRTVTAGAVDQGEKPAVPSAILKYHTTEMGRLVANDAMDVHGGKGICLGPNNYLARSYESVPIAITVEGANILSRSLIIFGQGAIRCHPYVLREMHAAQDEDHERGLDEFDRVVFDHVGNAIGNAARSLVLALTNARFTGVPVHGAVRRYYQHINRFSASFALAADVAMLTLGGSLKKRELLSARLGDVLSAMYLASMVLKHYENEGRPAEDLPLVEWACRDLLYDAQEKLHSFLRNFPNGLVATVLRLLVFPRGLTYSAPGDALGRAVVELVTHPTTARERLCAGTYNARAHDNPLGLLDEALELALEAEPLLKRLHAAVRAGKLSAPDLPREIDAAEKQSILSPEEANKLRELDRKVMRIIAVDDFPPGAFGVKAAQATKARKESRPPKAERQTATAEQTEQPAREERI
ncbi:MAG: acyl-CoA dehydrogenase [Gammaproteobacteria bacterium]